MRPSEPRVLRVLSIQRAVPAVLMLCLGAGLCALAAEPLAAQSGEPWVAPERRAARPNPLQATPEHIAEGKKLYLRECASCHGDTGRNDGAKAPKEMPTARKLTDPVMWEESDGALFWKIAEGRRPMPSTLEVLNDRERWQVVLYMRTLAPRPGTNDSPAGR
jgi:mono/diheme cytochrome c family protein